MSDYEQTLKHPMDCYQDEILINCLVNYYDTCKETNGILKSDQDLLWAIERVLQDFMTYTQFEEWRENR